MSIDRSQEIIPVISDHQRYFQLRARNHAYITEVRVHQIKGALLEPSPQLKNGPRIKQFPNAAPHNQQFYVDTRAFERFRLRSNKRAKGRILRRRINRRHDQNSYRSGPSFWRRKVCKQWCWFK